MERTEPTFGNGRQTTAREGADRPLGALFRELSEESSALIHAEMALARRELSDKVTQAERGISALAVGAAVSYAGALAVLFGVIALLSLAIPLWLAAVLIGVVVGAVGVVSMQQGRAKVSAETLSPRRTLRQAARTVEAGKEQLS
jgi:hypothetical protein